MVSGFWEYFTLGKNFYRKCFEGVCKKYSLNPVELDILIFLEENPQYDTATDITEKRGIAKSNASIAIRRLTEQGILEGFYQGNNRRTIHLKRMEKSQPILADAALARDRFLSAVFAGFTETELEQIKVDFSRLVDNIKAAKEADTAL